MQCAKFCGHQEKTSLKEMTFSRTAKMRFAWKFLGLDPEFTDQLPKALQSRLDGVYWK
jgi:hypothetical protein